MAGKTCVPMTISTPKKQYPSVTTFDQKKKQNVDHFLLTLSIKKYHLGCCKIDSTEIS
jgi:hypothetical protein